MPPEKDILDIFAILLTAEIFNKYPDLGINDLPPQAREVFSIDTFDQQRPVVVVNESAIARVLGVTNAHERLTKNPFASYEEFGHRLSITELTPAFRWFLKHNGQEYLANNPALAWYGQNIENMPDVSYETTRNSNSLFEDTRIFLDKKIAKMLVQDERLRSGLDLIIIYAPEEVEQTIDDLVCSPDQLERIKKLQVALQNIEFLKKHRIVEIGKLLFIGPPGTGKTSLAFALSHIFHMPLLEVRLSMVTSQYLGETSKNIDRIFDVARALAPSILFIDEFDFLAKSRVGDDHGAMKRAVNALLKNIDKINLVKNNVLLIGATNHPHLLDEAAWRRFDEVMLFDLPDEQIREQILSKILTGFSCSCDYRHLAQTTEGFSGSDLRMLVREAVLTALLDSRTDITEDDVSLGKDLIQARDINRNRKWYG
ncbi:MAG: ATP-binding protein [Methanospirillaceae archaeon]|nr:ATP-binding protein [Methanospirillaceae archaeon]